MSKFTNPGLLLLCFWVFLFRGKAKKISREPKKVLILRWTPHMGDVVYTTPLFSAIKRKYPNCKVYVVGRGRVGDVIRHNPDVDEFIEYKDNFFETVRRIRKEKFDFGCVAKPGTSEGFALLYLGGVKTISLFDILNEPKVKSWTYPWLLKLGIPIPFYNHRYIPPQFLKLLEPLGVVNPDGHFKLYFSKEADNVIDKLFSDNFVNPEDFVVGMAPGGSTEDRWWPAERFAKLADILAKEYDARIFIIGAGKDEKAISEFIKNLNPQTKYTNLLNQNLDEFKAFISRAKLIIGNDSGPMVTADAFDVAQMIFVGPTDEKEYHHEVTPTYRILKAKNNNMDSITLDIPIKELYYLVDNIKK